MAPFSGSTEQLVLKEVVILQCSHGGSLPSSHLIFHRLLFSYFPSFPFLSSLPTYLSLHSRPVSLSHVFSYHHLSFSLFSHFFSLPFTVFHSLPFLSIPRYLFLSFPTIIPNTYSIPAVVITWILLRDYTRMQHTTQSHTNQPNPWLFSLIFSILFSLYHIIFRTMCYCVSVLLGDCLCSSLNHTAL